MSRKLMNKLKKLKTSEIATATWMEGRVAILEHLVKVQEILCDDIEQYGRRLCLRVDDMLIIQNEFPTLWKMNFVKNLTVWK